MSHMTYQLLIDGKLVPGAGEIDVINPATGEAFAKCPVADETQLNAAVAAAKRAFPAWSKRPWTERQALLEKLCQELIAHRDELARTLTQEQGKPVFFAGLEVDAAVDTIRKMAALGELPSEVIHENDQKKVVEQRTPLGVIAAITPWNFPIVLLVIKLAPALVTGNTVVAKPAPTTPLTTLMIGEMAQKIFPPGVFNVIADKNDLGGKLTSHPDIAKVAFTGSTATGKKVMQSVASTLKRITLELGGNDAAILLDDVDPKAAAANVFMGATFNSGQVCVAVKRVYVHESMYDAVCDELAKLADATVVDDGLKQGAQMGPIQNKAQYEKVLGYIEDAKKRGKVLTGGAATDKPGYFIRPTIVRDIPDDAPLVKEEQFGPVLPVLKYADIDEAIARANDSEYGLAGSVWSKDENRAVDVAMKVNSGTIWVNKWGDMDPEVPFGGSKQSGMGTEYALDGVKEYTQRKVINIAK
jgi:acyl-CoA reductase-like NAD-dependent aldehyde dehydrogenase